MSFASASVCARLETRSSSIVTGLLSGCGIVLPLLGHLIRPREHFDWNCQTNLFCRLEVNDEFKLRCLLHRQIRRFSAFQYLVHVNSSAPKLVSVIHPVGHETALINKPLLWVNSRQPVFAGKLDDPPSFGEKAVAGRRHNRAHLLLLCGLKGAL